LMAIPIIMLMDSEMGQQGQGLGLLGGGYGAVQVAITGISWLPAGWPIVVLLSFLALAKLVASSLTIGSGGSAGDFAPSLAIGGLLGGAFGRAAQLLFQDPRIDPGAFALVGMGAFYGGIAHVPLSALVLVCEMAGSYDLLVPLMLAEGIAVFALRRHTLYHAQAATPRDSPAHRDQVLSEMVRSVLVSELMTRDAARLTLTAGTTSAEMLRRLGESKDQDVFPIADRAGKLIGLVTASDIRLLEAHPDAVAITVAADIMQAPVVVRATDPLGPAIEMMLKNRLRELPVVDDELRVIGFLDEAQLAMLYVAAAARAEARQTDS
jgi:chloride channel protein, CIC family